MHCSDVDSILAEILAKHLIFPPMASQGLIPLGLLDKNTKVISTVSHKITGDPVERNIQEAKWLIYYKMCYLFCR